MESTTTRSPWESCGRSFFRLAKRVVTIQRVYVILASLIFLLSLRAELRLPGNSNFAVEDLKRPFIIVAIFTAAFLILAWLLKKLDTELALRSIILTGIFLRICYTFVTDIGERTYDVYRDKWGHLDYIKYIAQNFALPPVNECQTYHPPVHHIIAAFALDIGKAFTQRELFEYKLIQLVMVLLSSLTLMLFYKILKELNCSSIMILTAVSLFAFHPTNIYFSSRINNDNTLLFFYTLAFYFLIKWANTHRLKDIILLSLTAALAVLTKFSGVMLVPLIAMTFTTVLKKNRSERGRYLKQYCIFGLVFVPLAMSYQVRNYVLFNQGFGYVPSLGKGFIPTLYNLIFIPVYDILQHPFNNGGLNGGEFFMEFFLKSSLFGEWQYPGLERIARPMLILAAAIALVILLSIVLPQKSMAVNHRYVFLLNLLVPILLEMKLRTDMPVACSQDFRYAAPVLISAAFFLGEAVSRLKLSKLRILKYAVIVCNVSFCALSAVFVLSLGHYN